MSARKPSRRQVISAVARALPLVPFAGGLAPAWLPLVPKARAGTAPHRFLQIFLLGGWDSTLAGDPLVGGKVTSGAYDPTYAGVNAAVTPVAGKANLNVGHGFALAAPAFAQMPTAFVNGIYVQVTAHELAVNYLYSGQLSLSRSREYPAAAALMGKSRGGFPAHVVLGSRIPLGSTSDVPPLHSTDVGNLNATLAGAHQGTGQLTDPGLAAADALTGKLNAMHDARLTPAGVQSLAPWDTTEGGLAAFFAKRFDQQIVLTPAINTRYAVASPNSLQALMAGAFMVLKSNLSSIVTVNFGGFDTHFNHLSTQVPQQQATAAALAALVNDLVNTPDPDDASQSLAATTTILITSEFVRTPKFNLNGGTDHWQSGSAILMGKGVKDNVVVGATDDNAKPMGWSQGAAVSFTQGAALLPDHLSASLLRALGFSAQADAISAVNLPELFS